MTKVVINFRSEEWIHECLLYSRELSPVYFDEGEMTVHLLFTIGRETPQPKHARMRRRSSLMLENKVDLNFTENANNVSHFMFYHPLCKRPSEKDLEIECDVPDHLTICIIPQRQCMLHMNAHLACCVSIELTRNRKFRRRFLKYVGRMYGFCTDDDHYDNMDFSDLHECEFLTVVYLVDITTTWPKQRIDYPWHTRLQCLVAKRQILEEVMSWLSTLGGAYSSLGDYFQSHAHFAGVLSKQQLHVAMELGDPIVAAKCRIFFALSLLQRGCLRECKRIVRSQYKFAVSTTVYDQKLVNMCLAVWSRLKYAYKMRKIKQHPDNV